MWIKELDCEPCLLCEETECAISSQQIEINYMVGYVLGNKSQGLVSVDDKFNQSEFLIANQIKGMEGVFFEGIVGLQQDSNHSFIQWPVSFFYNSGNSARQAAITFGGYDESLFTGNIKYINSSGQWRIFCDEIILSNIVGYNQSILIDSGTSLLIFPKQTLIYISQEFSKCQFNEIIRCPCPTQDISNFPTFIFKLDGQEFTLEPSYYIQVNPHDPMCHVLISNMQSKDKVILGSPFMRKYYTIFDKDNERIGLAESIKDQIKVTYNFKYLYILLTSLGISAILIKILNYFIHRKLSKDQKGMLV